MYIAFHGIVMTVGQGEVAIVLPVEHGQGDDGSTPFRRLLEGLSPRASELGVFWCYLWHGTVFVLGIDNVLHGLFYHAACVVVIDKCFTVEPVLFQPA